MHKNPSKAALLALATLIAAAGVTTTAAVARERVQVREKVCHTHRDANRGTVIGAVGGGLLGNAIGGHGAGGTIIGAGAGAVAGHEIGKSQGKRNCHYETRWVYR